MELKYKNLIILYLGILIVSCNSNDTKNITFSPKLAPKLVSSVNKFSDTIFVSDYISSIVFHDNNYYFLDTRSATIICTDENFEFKSIIGKRGQGPGESAFLLTLGVFDDKVYLNGNGTNLNVFDTNGNFISAISYARDVGQIIGLSRMVIKENKITGCFNGKYSHEGSPFVTFDFSGNIITVSKGTVNEITKTISSRSVYELEYGGFVSVVNSFPVIDVYDNNMNYMRSVDISYIEVIKKYMEQKESLRNDPNAIYNFTMNSYCVKNKLYLLCVSTVGNTHNPNNSCNTIIELDLSENTFTHSRTIMLPDDWYISFCVSPDGKILTAHNTFKATIDQFDIGEQAIAK